jgi:hypothetical protein
LRSCAKCFSAFPQTRAHNDSLPRRHSFRRVASHARGFSLMAADDTKRIHCVKVCFTDREYIDLNRAAVRAERSKADMAYVLVKLGMYGILNKPDLDDLGTKGSDDGPR